MQLSGKAAWKSAPLIENLTLCRAAATSEPWQQHLELGIQRPCSSTPQAVLVSPCRGEGTQDIQALLLLQGQCQKCMELRCHQECWRMLWE